LPVRDLVGGDSLGIGLWIPNEASIQLAESGAQSFAQFLSERRLQAFTINGFPFDNFHRDVVKHDVYRPTWFDMPRLEYTKRLARILAAVLPEDQPIGSISTLPIGWPCRPGSDERVFTSGQISDAAANLREMAFALEQLESETGRRVVLAIEPEPGCELDTTSDCVEFFDQHLPDPLHRKYITVCHDICHAAVMMEDQRDVVSRLSNAGIGIGKVQVSSAIQVDWDAMAVGRRWEALEQLAGFAEDRYLHQTGRRTESGDFVLEEDLPGLLDSVHAKGLSKTDDPVAGDQRWVIHFHVPIFLERFGHLSTTQSEVRTLLRTFQEQEGSLDFTGHYEVETYAWTVLPESMQKRGLSGDIAAEIQWLKENQ